VVADSVAISHDGKTIYFDRSSLSAPNDIYAMKRGGTATKVTHDNDALLAQVTMGSASDLWYDGAGGTPVQALMVKTTNVRSSEKFGSYEKPTSRRRLRWRIRSSPTTRTRTAVQIVAW
jgi:dipeptidyl aminopeptidase/acylaminoacyl peptidase